MFVLSGVVNWYGGLSRLTKIATGIGAVLGAVVAFAQAAPVVEPYWIAHRGYVREHAAPLSDHAILVRVQLRQNYERRQRLIDEAAKRELELQSDQAKQLPQYKDLVQNRVDRLKEELKRLDDEDNSLFKEKIK